VEPADCNRISQREDYGTVPLEEMLPYPDEGGDFFVIGGTGPVQDLGQGIVATEYRYEYRHHGERGVYFDHCGSGQGFFVLTRQWQDDDVRTLDLDPYAVVRAAMASDRAMTMAEVAAMFGGSARLDAPVETEVCGCAAFYPEARGARAPYDPWGPDH
jgi:hypothetical protein